MSVVGPFGLTGLQWVTVSCHDPFTFLKTEAPNAFCPSQVEIPGQAFINSGPEHILPFPRILARQLGGSYE